MNNQGESLLFRRFSVALYTAYDVVGFTVLLVNMMSILQSSKSLQMDCLFQVSEQKFSTPEKIFQNTFLP